MQRQDAGATLFETGEIRAVGHVLPDQYLFLKRTGFTSVEAPEGTNLESWANALSEVSVVYQPGLGKDDPNPLINRWLKPEAVQG